MIEHSTLWQILAAFTEILFIPPAFLILAA